MLQQSVGIFIAAFVYHSALGSFAYSEYANCVLPALLRSKQFIMWFEQTIIPRVPNAYTFAVLRAESRILIQIKFPMMTRHRQVAFSH